jgi:hypothetical protein
MTQQGEVSRLMGYMPIIARAPDITDWERQFAISIAGRLKRKPGFQPTEKQVSVMTRIVDKFQRDAMADDIVERGQ